MKKHKNIKFVVPLEIFKKDVMFLIDCSAEQANKSILKFNIPFAEGHFKFYDSGGVRGQMTMMANGAIAVWIKKKEDIPTLIHETVHVVQYACRSLRMELKEENEELHAYMIEYLFRECNKKLKFLT
jgi:hypothetical protein